MKMNLVLRQRLEQKLKLAPQIIQSIEILQLPALDLQDLIARELEENPVLEIIEPTHSENAVSEAEAANEIHTTTEGESAEFEHMPEMEDSFFGEFPETFRKRRESGDTYGKMEAMKDTPSRTASLQEYLYEQISLMDINENVRQIAEEIVFNISDDGYLRYSLEAITESIDMPTLYIDAEEALDAIQSLEPIGIGARNLAECLLLQVRNQPDAAFNRELITNHIKDIELNRLPKIAKDTGRTLEEIKESIEHLRTLNPRPGSLYSSKTAPYVTPDATVECIDDEYRVKLEDHYIPEIYINESYHKMLSENKNNPKISEFIRKKLESARWLIDAISQRRSTLSKIINKIVEIQQDFFEKGVEQLVPLKMQEVADAIGVHNSTVSRAISNKYIQTPRGVFALKYFFSGGTTAEDGTVESRVSVKQRVQNIVDNEDKSAPLSDDDIAAKLKESGLEVARRTITKYRRMMSIPSSRQRREY